ncbi:MAG TPA: cob(I)yrinic acid a,c-diamide adenosyltransferase, partial [bacterium]|nr:cob(I)yrinic acid a,c-diamide adenosyltransferase [bacterium]
VLDEVNNALRDKFLLFEELEALLEIRPRHVELVCTGRGAPKELVELADYVTEFTALKHPGTRKIGARKGIEF